MMSEGHHAGLGKLDKRDMECEMPEHKHEVLEQVAQQQAKKCKRGVRRQCVGQPAEDNCVQRDIDEHLAGALRSGKYE